jgi:peptidoglycan/LPS O-acetylase OafA/YrhL
MRSSTGSHFIALDHIRALAAFMVFAWHFNHSSNGYPVSFDYIPSLFPFALLDEGHTGVALFMTLSGYLFAKLLDGKTISYPAFFLNRVLRLLPLLIVVIVIVGIKKINDGENILWYAYSIAKGILLPSLPNGGWSITVEFHYYLILPLLLWMSKKSKFLPALIIIVAIFIRTNIYHERGEIQSLAYWSIIGRIDQFIFGMLAFQFRSYITGRHYAAISIFFIFSIIYWNFDLNGGFYKNPSYPSTSILWIFLPTIEAIAYAFGIAWYDNSFSHSRTGFSALIGRLGEYSYSIYLFHFFIVFDAARFVNENIMDISNFYLACLWATVFFFLMIPIGYFSFIFIELPFLKLRKRYINE